jgi:glycosyltransferase involved in cell wall biosynthesis
MALSPPLTVILPAHNAEATIGAAIASTLSQTYADFELWVLENGSTDHTAQIAWRFNDPRVRVFELGAVGFQGAIQYAIEHASSDWLARMDADDLMFPERLKRQMEVIRQRPDLVMVGAAAAMLTPFGHIFERLPKRQSEEFNTLKLGRAVADPSMIFNRRAALEVGGVDSEFTIGDVALFLRMLQQGRGWQIAECLYLYRLQPNSMSQQLDFYHQALRARAKYAPQTLDHVPSAPNGHGSVWGLITSLELATGDRRAVRHALDSLEHYSPKKARRIRWLNSCRVSHLYYRWRNRNYYRRRPDWEKLFAPFFSLRQTPAGPA